MAQLADHGFLVMVFSELHKKVTKGSWTLGDFGPKLLPQNQLDIYFLTVWEHWLGIAKPKNVFRSTLLLNGYKFKKNLI